MSSGVAIEIIISVVTFVVSVGSSMFIAGMHWGGLQSEMRSVADRLAKIEGMFTLKLKDEGK